MDTLNYLVQQMMVFSIPLLIVALGGLYSERSGVVNIALDGIMIIGAFSSVFFIHYAQAHQILSGQSLLLVALLIAGLVGGLFSLLHAVAAIHLKADQTISGTALNIFAPAFAVYVARMILGNKGIGFANQFIIPKVPLLSKIPVIGDLFFTKAYLTTYIGILILVVTWFVLYKTKFGLRLRSCGENPHAADAAGINVYKIRYMGVFLSGVLAGMGGLVFILPISTEFSGDVAGYGFLALAVLIFGQWHPWKILGAAFMFGLMKTISFAYSGIPFFVNLGIPNVIYKLFPYVLTLIILAFTSKNSAAPLASGEPYDKGKR